MKSLNLLRKTRMKCCMLPAYSLFQNQSPQRQRNRRMRTSFVSVFLFSINTCLSLCLFVRLLICLSVCLSLSVYLSVCVLVYLSDSPFDCLSVSLSICVCLPVSLSLSLAVYMSVSFCVSIYLSVCHSLYLRDGNAKRRCLS